MNRRITLAIAVLATLAIAVALYFGLRTSPAPRAEPPAVTALSPGEIDPKAFAVYYPRHFDSFQRNAEIKKEPSLYGGSDPQSKLEQFPYMKFLWKGYPFSEEYLEDRGHVYTVQDVTKTGRKPGKAVCLSCKSANFPSLIKSMGDDFYKAPFKDMLARALTPVSCSDCHNPVNMELRITRPALTEAFQRRGKDITKATRQEMRTLVCAQCHVEYFFDKATFKLTFPWDRGLEPDNVFEYYQDRKFFDFTHPDSKVPVLKVQHPDYELFLGGPHQSAGVACADCHMPYIAEGNTKISSHWWTSPLRTLNESCGPCHRTALDQLRQRVLYTQDRVKDLLDRAGNANVLAAEAIAAAASVSSADQMVLDEARQLQRESQWYWDWVGAENSMGFHNPQGAMSALGKSIDLALKARETAARAIGQETPRKEITPQPPPAGTPGGPPAPNQPGTEQPSRP